eukprot:TRINITY_DN432_c0_g1_i1.p1 TRINITY_DN432_c0_g1~~TRINITY_DN432_c0_g1_i1.p1  ORF type:complete len:501 (-),score=175.04 TRINITY_DN432_c0_g1_i1:61-1521(-)
MSIWVDKYRPHQLSQLDHDPDLTNHLQSLVDVADFPHLLLYGPSGSGKKTRISSLLREMFGPNADKLKVDQKVVEIPNKSTTVEICTISSSHHIEINPSSVGNNDRYVIQEVLKEIAQSHPLDATVKHPFGSMSIWVDKYRPHQLSQLDHDPDLTNHLQSLVDVADFPHLLLYGPSGSGKKTRISSLLREMFGPNADKLKVDQKVVEIPNKSTTVEICTISSSHHIEINPSSVGNNDRYVIQEVLKEIAQSHPLDATAKRPFKIIVIDEADRLSRVAQQALRRTMEVYMATCRLIMCCSSLSKVMEPVRSRCLCLRVASPTHQEICGILSKIAKSEGVNLPAEFAMKLAKNSKRNLRRAILSFEASKANQYPFQPTQNPDRADWEEYIALIAKEIVEEQSPKSLLSVRNKLYELLTHCIPPEVIFQSLVNELLKRVDADVRYELIHWATYHEHRMQCGSKPIFHLEAFIARFMSIYSSFIISMFGE